MIETARICASRVSSGAIARSSSVTTVDIGTISPVRVCRNRFSRSVGSRTGLVVEMILMS